MRAGQRAGVRHGGVQIKAGICGVVLDVVNSRRVW